MAQNQSARGWRVSWKIVPASPTCTAGIAGGTLLINKEITGAACCCRWTYASNGRPISGSIRCP
jgi:hypothetical protein